MLVSAYDRYANVLDWNVNQKSVYKTHNFAMITQVNPYARVAELVDALVSGTSVFGRGGSSPLSRTKKNPAKPRSSWCMSE